MSPTIYRELMAVRRQLRDPVASGWYRTYLGSRSSRRILEDPMRLFKAELPERRYHEASFKEHQEAMAAGGRTICPQCGQRSVKDDTVCTYGYSGHPGADYSAFYECENENCDYKSLG